MDAIPAYNPSDYAGGIAGMGFNILYNSSVVRVSGRAPMQGSSLMMAGAGSFQASFSEPVPDSDGNLLISEVDNSQSYESGPGVLTRVTFEAVGPGSSYVLASDARGSDGRVGDDNDGIPGIYGANTHTYEIGSILNARIVVGTGSCSDPPPPTPTVSPTPFFATPTPPPAITPTPLSPLTPVSLAIDAKNLAGNSPTSHGAIDDCAVLSVGEMATLDIVVDGVQPVVSSPHSPYLARGIAGFAFDLTYNSAVLRVIAKAPVATTSLIAASGSYGVITQSNSVPDFDGNFKVFEGDSSSNIESGSGVLIRLTVQAMGVGITNVVADDVGAGDHDGLPDVYDYAGGSYPVSSAGKAKIIVGAGSCGATPTPSPSPTPVPTATPIPLPTATVTNPQSPQECGGMTFDTVLTGTSANDNIIGTQGRDLILGLGGNDYISGQNGNDCVVGGDGNDTLFGDGNDDVIVGGSGDEYVAGGSGNDRVWAGAGNDFMQGQAGTDSCDGGAGTGDSQSTCETVAGVP